MLSEKQSAQIKFKLLNKFDIYTDIIMKDDNGQEYNILCHGIDSENVEVLNEFVNNLEKEILNNDIHLSVIIISRKESEIEYMGESCPNCGGKLFKKTISFTEFCYYNQFIDEYSNTPSCDYKLTLNQNFSNLLYTENTNEYNQTRKRKR